jgi:hypothetical protein
MSNRGKIIVIIGGAAAFLLVGLVAVVFFVAWVVDDTGMEENRIAGTEFGKTTDYAGCQAAGVERIKNLSLFQVSESVNAQYFVRGCLETSRPSPDFCENVPTEMQDIWAGDSWKDGECARLGWTEMNPNCRAVLRARLDFCGKQ